MTAWRFAVALVLIWALAFAASYTLDGYIHLVLVTAIVISVVQFLRERRSAKETPK